MREKIECTVEFVELENDSGNMIPGVCVTCKECGHSEESFGTGDNSIKRSLALLRENCPEGGENFYVDEDD